MFGVLEIILIFQNFSQNRSNFGTSSDLGTLTIFNLRIY